MFTNQKIRGRCENGFWQRPSESDVWDRESSAEDEVGVVFWTFGSERAALRRKFGSFLSRNQTVERRGEGDHWEQVSTSQKTRGRCGEGDHWEQVSTRLGAAGGRRGGRRGHVVNMRCRMGCRACLVVVGVVAVVVVVVVVVVVGAMLAPSWAM